MNRYAVAVGSNGSRNLVGLHDLQPLATPSGIRAVMMARPDVNVQVIELPAVPEAEIAGFLAYRIRSLYPGQPDETSFDHRVLKWAGRRYAVLFLVRRPVLDEYRRVAEGRPLFLPYFLIAPLVRSPRPGRVTVGMLWHPAWIEALVLPPSGPPRSHLLPRTGEAAADLERLEALLPEGSATVDWRAVAAGSELGELQLALARPRSRPDSVTVVPLEQALRRLGRRPPSLFTGRRRRIVIPRRVRVPVAALLLAAFSYLALARSVSRDEAYASLLRRTVLETQVRVEESQTLQRDIDGLREELASLRAAKPVDPGQVLAELVTLLGPGTRLQSFSLENGSFQLEAVGNDPLRLMDRFTSHEAFDDVRLLQIVPQKGSAQELFRVTGRVR